MSLLDHLDTEAGLDACLSTPSAADIACCRRLDGDVLVLGAAGKMGPRWCSVSCGRCRPPACRIASSRRRDSRRRRRGRCSMKLGSHDRRRPAGSGKRRRAARQPDRAVSRGTQIRFDRQHGADMGHQHDRARQCRPAFSARAHRRVLHRQRVSLRARVVARQQSRAMRRRRAASTRNRASGASACSSITHDRRARLRSSSA